jgi:hypothetical protein
MTFVNLSLLAGALFVAVPVVLHLLMRQRPKPMVFPALRFIQQRREANSRRLQLRHWVLLALRCAAIGVLAVALARPSVASAAVGNWLVVGLLATVFLAVGGLAGAAMVRRTSNLLTAGLGIGTLALGIALLWFTGTALSSSGQSVMGDEEAPVAAVLAIDNSPRMLYQNQNQDRLSVSQELAEWLLKQLPADSEVAVLDARPGGAAFSVDRAAAVKTIKRLKAAGTTRSMADVLQSAVALAAGNERSRKEVYLFTDLSRASWPAEASADIQQLLKDRPEVLVYVIDVGVERPQNLSLGDLKLSGQLLPQSGSLELETELTATGDGGDKTVELTIEQPDPTLPVVRDGKVITPKSVRRGSESVKVESNASQVLRFAAQGLPPGVHQGQVRIIGQDGLNWDDVRYFAVEVQQAWPILVVAPPGVSTTYLTESLAPREFRENEQSRFLCDVLLQVDLDRQELAEYRAICLVDPLPLEPETWEKLASYVEKGGGLAVFLGHNAQPAAFQDAAALRVLGGKVSRQSRGGSDLYLAPRTYDHPVTAAFRLIEANVPWNRFPVYYHWNLVDLEPQTRVVIPYGNGMPALVDHRLGRGHVLTLTTPVSDPLRPAGRSAWNELPTGEDAWPCFVLVNEMLLNLVGSGEMKLNYLAGETAVLPNDDSRFPDRYQLFTPLDEPQDVSVRDGRVMVRFTDNPGSYRLRGSRSGPIVRGFAVNVPAQASNLTRLKPEDLDTMLGKGRYQFARSKEEINRAVGNDRIGSEFYPMLAVLLAAVLGLEQVLSNRFYRRDE